MVKQVVTIADSKSGAGTFYELTDSVASSFTLEQGAFLHSTTDDSISLSGTASWTVMINGQSSGGDEGLWDQSSGASKITIGEEGSLRSTTNATWGALLLGGGGSKTVVNKGVLVGVNGAGIYSDDNLVLTNSGLIAGGNSISLKLNNDNHIITNTGTLLGDIDFGPDFGIGNNKVTNSGLISHDTAYGAGNTHSNILFGKGNDTFDNKGVIDGFVDLGGGLNKGTNAKSITGKDGNDVTVLAGSGNDTFTNAKGATLAGGVNLGLGMNVFTNAGTVGEDNTGASYFGGDNVDTVKNSGILGGDVVLSKGDDVFTNTGQVLGIIDLGEGNDVFKGGNFAEFVLDNAGSDKIALGGGDDTFVAFGGAGDGEDGLMGAPAPDEVDGGAGIDTYDGSLASGGIRVNLDSVNQTSLNWVGAELTLTKGTAMDSTATYFDKLKGFENVIGSNLNDIIFGSAAANTIYGLGGVDELLGLAGNDAIDGGAGGDVIAGGLGADLLMGGANADYFYYSTIKDSGLTKATRDEILDFVDGVDLIHLDFDFDTTTFGNQSFITVIVDGTFTGDAGELRVYRTATGWMIEGDVTVDAKADFSIAVRDMDHSIEWTTDDFRVDLA